MKKDIMVLPGFGLIGLLTVGVSLLAKPLGKIPEIETPWWFSSEQEEYWTKMEPYLVQKGLEKVKEEQGV